MRNIKFSVIIPLYNKATCITRAVQSVLGQTYDEFELIVVDDGSTDGGGEGVRLIKDSRISLVRQENAGVSAARNRGISLAKGELVAFLDADDSWETDYLKTIGRLRVNFPQAGLYATAYQIVSPNGQSRSVRFHGIPELPWEGILPSYFRSAALGEPPVCASAVAIPHDILANCGGFAAGKRMGEDLDLWGKIALKYPVAFSSQVQATYYQNAENRACVKFGHGDEHPFIETVALYRERGETLSSNLNDVDLYLARLMTENVRQYVVSNDYYRARLLASKIHGPGFRLRRFIWGSRFNALTHFVWKLSHAVR